MRKKNDERPKTDYDWENAVAIAGGGRAGFEARQRIARHTPEDDE